MSLNINLLREICETPGAPGHEQRIRQVVLREATPHADEMAVDNMGNVTAIKRGRDPKRVMVAAHMDEISFIVSHIDDSGFLRFHPLGGFDPKTLTAQRVIVHGKKDLIGVMGSKPIHVMSPDERNKPPKITDFFIDMGMGREEVASIVSVGDVVTRQRELIEMGNCVNCKSIDNRVSVFILLEALRRLGEVPFDVYAVFTVQEEVGIRGANASALQHQPHFGIGLDTTIAFDVPGSTPHERVTELGKGTAIKIMDSSTICDHRMVRYMKEVADRNGIMWQPEVLPAGGTDTAAIQRMSAGGSISGAISIPTRHIHQVIEMADKGDIEASIRLLVHCLEDLDRFDWAH
jgi:endoglucanase